RSVVVLPHPEGPRSTTNSPSWMESDTSLTAATVSKFLLRFSKSNSPNGCSPRLLPAIRELWGQGARRTNSALLPARLLFVSHRPESIGSGHSWDLDDPLGKPPRRRTDSWLFGFDPAPFRQDAEVGVKWKVHRGYAPASVSPSDACGLRNYRRC